jgi:hypothetical protein
VFCGRFCGRFCGGSRVGVPLLIVLCLSVVFGLGLSDLIRINVEEVMVVL